MVLVKKKTKRKACKTAQNRTKAKNIPNDTENTQTGDRIDASETRPAYVNNIKRAHSATALKTRIKMRHEAKVNLLLDREEAENQELATEVNDFDSLILLADKSAIDFLNDVVRGLIPDVSTSQKIQAAKQIREIAESQTRSSTDDVLKQLGTASLKEALTQLNHQKGRIIEGTTVQESSPIRVLE